MKAILATCCTVLTVGAVVISTIPAQAAARARPAAQNVCYGLQVVCIFQDANGTGAGHGFGAGFLESAGVVNLTDLVCPPCRNGIHGNDGTWNDQMSSWGNDTGETFCWWTDINARGAGHLMRSLGPVIQNLLPSENDTASSIGVPNGSCH